MRRVAIVIVGIALLSASQVRAATILQFNTPPLVRPSTPIKAPTVKAPTFQLNTGRLPVAKGGNTRLPSARGGNTRTPIVPQPVGLQKYNIGAPGYGPPAASNASTTSSGASQSRRPALDW